MVENVVDDGVELKPAIIEVEASVDVKSTVEVKVNVKILFQSHIEEKPKLTSVSKLHDYEVNTASFFFEQMIDGESEMICLVVFVDKRQGRDLLYL
jgi:bifunctional N-acetylglucosamine-1-phosphate-uridyltransferase/glucosamine-1-phosphate-acetyltransferase GlmU-like protein